MSDAPPFPPHEEQEALPLLHDWATMVNINPRLYYRPQSVDQLKAMLTGLWQEGVTPDRIRVTGSRHSCSTIFASDGVIDVSELPKTIVFAPDNSSVTVSSNWVLRDFLIECGKRNKSLSATGGTDAQTLAGLISTNTAPATPKHSMYDGLQWVEYLELDPAGRKVTLKRVMRGDPTFPAMVCSLGVVGILTTVCFNLIDEPYYDTVQSVVKLADVLTNIEATSKKYDFWRINWIQETDEGLLWTANSVPAKDSKPNGDYPPDGSESILKFVYLHIDKLRHSGPLLDTFMKWVLRLVAATYKTTKATGPLRNMMPVDRTAPLHVAMAEWSFDPKRLDEGRAAVQAYFEKHKWPNLPIEIELVKADDYWMSSWNWGSGYDYLAKMNFQYLTDVCDAAGKQAISDHLEGLWNHLIASGIAFKGHWGKINFMDHAFVKQNYALDRFAPLVSPVLLNDYLSKRLTETT
jgi:FAD/FMN-containing dehydrogenase